MRERRRKRGRLHRRIEVRARSDLASSARGRAGCATGAAANGWHAGERRWEPSGAVPQRAPRQQDRLHHWPTVTLRTLQQQPYLLHSREEHPRSASSQGLAPVEESKLVHFISVAPVEESKRVPFFLEFHFSNGILPFQ